MAQAWRCLRKKLSAKMARRLTYTSFYRWLALLGDAGCRLAPPEARKNRAEPSQGAV